MRRRNGRLSSHVLSTVTVATSDLLTDVYETLNLLPEIGTSICHSSKALVNQIYGTGCDFHLLMG